MLGICIHGRTAARGLQRTVHVFGLHTHRANGRPGSRTRISVVRIGRQSLFNHRRGQFLVGHAGEIAWHYMDGSYAFRNAQRSQLTFEGFLGFCNAVQTDQDLQLEAVGLL